MSENRTNTASPSKKAGKNIFQGRFVSLDFFKRNAKYIIFMVVMALAYIANKFVCQSSMQEYLSLKEQLVDARTDLVHSCATYNSMILESEMTKLMSERHIGLSAPLEPPYQLNSQK